METLQHKNTFVLMAGLIIIAAIAGFVLTSREQPFSSERLTVVASFYPLAEFARAVGGDRIEVTTSVPSGTEPHDYEPTPSDRITLQRAKVFIFNGAGLEPWVERILPDLTDTVVIDVSTYISLLPAVSDEENESSASDPHFWLDPVLSQQIIAGIAQTLASIDPPQRSAYLARATAYIKQLADLDNKFRPLTQCAKKDIITSHAAFAYLAKRYGFNQIPIAGISEEEPSPARLAEITRLANAKNIKYIFFETLVSPKLSETIATEVGATTLVLNPIEGLTLQDEQQGENYISLMEKNLVNLQIALECHV